MLEAGVSKEVVKAHIENSSDGLQSQPGDLIALKLAWRGGRCHPGAFEPRLGGRRARGPRPGGRHDPGRQCRFVTAEPAVATPVRIVNMLGRSGSGKATIIFSHGYLPQNPRQCLSNPSATTRILLRAGFFPVLRRPGTFRRVMAAFAGPALRAAPSDFSALTRLRLSSAKHPGSLELPGPVGAGYRVFEEVDSPGGLASLPTTAQAATTRVYDLQFRFFALEPFGEFPAAHAIGHDHVGQEQADVRLVPAPNRERRHTRPGVQHLIPEPLQQIAHQLAQRVFVFDHQNGFAARTGIGGGSRRPGIRRLGRGGGKEYSGKWFPAQAGWPP